MTQFQETPVRASFSEKHGGKIFTLAGILLSFIIGSTICLVMEETFRERFFDKYELLVRLIQLGPLSYVVQVLGGIFFFSFTYVSLKQIQNRKPYEPLKKLVIRLTLLLCIHLAILTGLSYWGMAGFTAVAENGYLTLDSTWKYECIPWDSFSSGTLTIEKNGLNRDVLHYSFTLRSGGKKDIFARMTDVKSITESSWVYSRQNLELAMDEKTFVTYKKLLSVLGN